MSRLRRSAGADSPEARLVDAYRIVYDRRLRTNDGRAFKAPVQNALVALLRLRIAQEAASADTSALRALVEISRHVLERESSHSLAVDMVGHTWAAAYGVLPIEEPPLIQLGWVLESGGRSGGVSGIAGVAWRSLFLARAVPLLNWRQRRAAETELVRRSEHLASRVASIVEGESAELLLEPQQRAQIVVPAAALADALRRDDLHRAVAALAVSAADVLSLDDSRPSAHVAQVALALDAAGEHDRRDALRAFLLEHRRDAGGELIARDTSPGAPAELSPWMPLAFVSSTGRGSA